MQTSTTIVKLRNTGGMDACQPILADRVFPNRTAAINWLLKHFPEDEPILEKKYLIRNVTKTKMMNLVKEDIKNRDLSDGVKQLICSVFDILIKHNRRINNKKEQL